MRYVIELDIASRSIERHENSYASPYYTYYIFN